MLSTSEKTGSAMILDPTGIQTLDVGSAMKRVIAPLVKDQKSLGKAFGVLVYGKHEKEPKPNVLVAVDTFFRAYRRALKVLEASGTSLLYGASKKRQRIEIGEFGDVLLYMGQDSETALEKKVELTPGVYIMTALLDTNLLEALNLPPLPERFRELPMIVQVKDFTETDIAIKEPIVVPAENSAEPIDRDSLEWRKEFLRSLPSWNSAQVAEQAASSAGNKAALASRWLNENKIFAVRFGGQQLFPKFQFQDGHPVPAIAKVIDVFPKHANGWDFAYFFSTPNAYVDNRRPLELLRSDPDRVISLAKTFVHPADAF